MSNYTERYRKFLKYIQKDRNFLWKVRIAKYTVTTVAIGVYPLTKVCLNWQFSRIWHNRWYGLKTDPTKESTIISDDENFFRRVFVRGWKRIRALITRDAIDVADIKDGGYLYKLCCEEYERSGVRAETNTKKADYMKCSFFLSNEAEVVHSCGCSRTGGGSTIYVPSILLIRDANSIYDIINNPLSTKSGSSFSIPDVKDISGKTYPLTAENLDPRDKSSILYCLTLSEEAKRFIIQKEIQRRRKFFKNVWMEPLWFALLIGILPNGYGFSFQNFPVTARTIMTRVLTRMTFAILGVIMYANVRMFNESRLEQQADEYTCLMGPEYARGGVEYYSKMLRLGRILRSRLHDDDSKFYAMAGNPSLAYMLRNVYKRMPEDLKNRYGTIRRTLKKLDEDEAMF